MKEWLVGQDALAIEKCYADMIRMRAQWHAHWTQNPTVSGIDMALWDIAGKVFNRSVSELTTGRFRDEIELYVNTAGPKDWFDPAACRDWADEVKAEPHGFRTVKFGFEGLLGRQLAASTQAASSTRTAAAVRPRLAPPRLDGAACASLGGC